MHDFLHEPNKQKLFSSISLFMHTEGNNATHGYLYFFSALIPCSTVGIFLLKFGFVSETVILIVIKKQKAKKNSNSLELARFVIDLLLILYI